MSAAAPSPDPSAVVPAAPRLCVVSAANAAYFPGLVVAFHSLLTHLAPGWTADFKVLTDDADQAPRAALADILRSTGRDHTLEILDLDLRAYDDYPALAGSRLAYARLLIPGLFDLPRALYLDCDIVVLKDVSRLAALPWPDSAVLHAVRDSKIPTLGMDWETLPCRELGLPPAAPYFNTGLLWMNLDAWRRQNVDATCRAYVARFPDRLRWHDQSILNAVLWDRWTPLDPAWNLPSELTLRTFQLYPFRACRDMNVHYTGSRKPWSKAHPLEYVYRDAARRIAPLYPPAPLLRPRRFSEAPRHLRFFAQRAVWHYGGFCKRTLRRSLRFSG